MLRFPRHESGEALSAALDEVEPEMVRQRTVSICPLGRGDQINDARSVERLELSLDLESTHGVRVAVTC
jgi:hypothetical protein